MEGELSPVMTGAVDEEEAEGAAEGAVRGEVMESEGMAKLATEVIFEDCVRVVQYGSSIRCG